MSARPDRVGTTDGPHRHVWTGRDCGLYALAVGAGFDDADFVRDDLGESQQAYPTFALRLVSGDAAARVDDLLGAVDGDDHVVVLGEQHLTLHRPVPARGEAALTTRLAAIHDKGSGAVVVLEVTATATDDGSPLFTTTMPMFAIGAGGFGGDRGPSRQPVGFPERPADVIDTFEASPVQSLWYRHAGDDHHAIHVDPEAARAAGFDGPILTGQNLLGIACRAIVTEVAGGRADQVREIGGRFASVAFNGGPLHTHVWVLDGGRLAFRVVDRDGTVVVDDGVCRLGRPDTPW